MKKQAFTLIELLIVVAIIAILAAIAVPNFLEAQVRSKVSRCQADMRSLATALESYVIDNNKYPNMGITYGLNDATAKLGFRLFPLTTPIAYITSLPRDPFNPGLDPMSSEGNDYFTYGEKDSNLINFQENYAAVAANPDTARWVLLSYGPYRNASDHPNYNSANMYWKIPYDATNGTVSIGSVHRVGP